MALIYVDSFDHQDEARYTTTGAVTSFETGRESSWAMRLVDGSGTNYSGFRQDFTFSGDTVIVGAALYPKTAANKNAYWLLDGVVVMILKTTAGGSFRVENGVGGLYCSGGSYTINQWVYVEVKITFAVSGFVELRVNGQSVDTFSGDTTSRGTNPDQLAAGESASSSLDGRIEDLVLMDGTGTAMNDFLGDVRVEFLQPTGDGNVIELTGSDGDQVNNYDNVNEALPSISDYNGSTGVGDTDLYTLTNLSTSASYDVHGVQVVGYIGKTPGETRFGRLIALEGTSTSLGSSVGLSTGYAYEYIPLNLTPGGSTWTQNSFNNLQIGFRVST